MRGQGPYGQPPHAPVQPYTGGAPPRPDGGGPKAMVDSAQPRTPEIFDLTINDRVRKAGEDAAAEVDTRHKTRIRMKQSTAQLVAKNMGHNQTRVGQLANGQTPNPMEVEQNSGQPPPDPGAGGTPIIESAGGVKSTGGKAGKLKKF